MSNLLDVSPTKGTLLELQDQLEEIRGGRDLLDRKREVLVQRLMELMGEAERLEEEAAELLSRGRYSLRIAEMRMGADRVTWKSRTRSSIQAELDFHSVMGVDVPSVRVTVDLPDRPYAAFGTSAALDQSRQIWLEVAHLLGDLAEKQTTVWRLATELRKTQRRVNALESIVIARYEATIDFIEQSLEEESREDIIRAKKVKDLRQES